MKVKLLIIEDDLQLRAAYQMYFPESDYEIVFALERVEIEFLVETVDLVICDYKFNPRLSFEEVMKMIAGRKPLILCSGELSKCQEYDNSVFKLDASRKLKPLVMALLHAA